MLKVQIKNDVKGRFVSVSVNGILVLIMGYDTHDRFPGLFDEMAVAVEEWAAVHDTRGEDLSNHPGLDPANLTLREGKP